MVDLNVHASTEPMRPSCVLKKAVGSSFCSSKENVLDQLLLECAVLRQFTLKELPNLPHLYDLDCTTSTAFPYLLIKQIGVPLRNAVHGLTLAERAAFVDTMLAQCSSALEAAVQVGHCHSDIAPSNIVLVGSQCCIIDWGLARSPGAPMHGLQGHAVFMHDTLAVYVEARDDAESTPGQHFSMPADVPYLPAYDQQALLYVHFVVQRGQPYLGVPWGQLGSRSMIRKRAAWMAAGASAVSVED